MEPEPSDLKLKAEKPGSQTLPPPLTQTPQTPDILLDIAALAVQSRTRADLFHQLAPHLCRLAQCEFVNFSFYDPVQNCMLMHIWRPGRESGELDGFPVNDCVSGHVWTTQKPAIISDTQSEERFPACLQILRKSAVRSYAGLPLSADAQRYGALGFGWSSLFVPTQQDVELLGRIAQVVALVLVTQDTNNASSVRQERLQNLVAIGSEMNSSLELEKLVAIILDNLRRIIQYDHAVLAIFEDDGASLKLCGVDTPDWEPRLAEGASIPVAQSPCARVFETRAVATFDSKELDQLATPVARALRRNGIHSLCCVPLTSTNRVWGSLDVASKREITFPDEDIEYLQQVASQIAHKLENSRSYREMVLLKDRLTGEKRYLETEVRSDKRWDEIIGNSAALQRVMEHASIVANTNSTVLITGETGTGKERVAHAIHNMSGRRDRNFIKLNCAAIPTGLVESELFGHERGAFTGAVSQKVGRLELADKGTLFLDEIGEIPLELQPKLLRVLQDQEFERLGGTRTIRVDVRLIAATNRDLARAVEENQFRRDLFYRLHVFPLHVPALRDRREDIPLLVRHFVDKCAARLRKKIDLIPDEAIEAMMKWAWPGNIRELENFIERSVILSRENTLRVPLKELRQDAFPSLQQPDNTLRGKEREHIVEVLRQCHGLLSGPSGAAARLGLKRTTLQYKMQKLGISRLDYLN